MKGIHWLTLGIGLAVGYFVLPGLIAAVRGAGAGA